RRRCSDDFFEREKRLRHRLERAAMDRTGSKFMESGEMQFGAVTLVLIETIFGKSRAEVTHDPIACDLRDHARGRDRQAVAIAVDDRGLWKWKWKNRESVDEDVIG